MYLDCQVTPYSFANIAFLLVARLVKPFPVTWIDTVTNAVLITGPVIGLKVPGAPVKEGDVLSSSTPNIQAFNVLVISSHPPLFDCKFSEIYLHLRGTILLGQNDNHKILNCPNRFEIQQASWLTATWQCQSNIDNHFSLYVLCPGFKVILVLMFTYFMGYWSGPKEGMGKVGLGVGCYYNSAFYVLYGGSVNYERVI